MRRNRQNEFDLEEAYLKFALNCFERLNRLSFDEFFQLENNLYENFLHSIGQKNSSSLEGKSA